MRVHVRACVESELSKPNSQKLRPVSLFDEYHARGLDPEQRFDEMLRFNAAYPWRAHQRLLAVVGDMIKRYQG